MHAEGTKSMKGLGLLGAGLVAVTIACTSSPVRSDLENAEQRRRGQAQESREMQQGQAASASQFGLEQNDAEGYDGLAWGSAPSANAGAKQAEAHQPGRNLQKIVGAPGHADRYGQYVGDPNGELLYYVDEESSPTFVYLVNEQTGTVYAYCNGKLAYTVAKLSGDYRDVEAALDNKFSVEGEIRADTWGNGSNDALNSHGSHVDGVFVGRAYRRGNTNTRIYLLQEVVNGFSDELVLLYIPNAYLTQIHDEWWNRFQAKEQSAREQQEKQAQQIRIKDEGKIQ
jgi:hypothetical protein